MSRRFHRQSLIEVDGDRWDQDRLLASRVAIVGGGPVGQHVASALSALGVGRIDLYDNQRLEDRQSVDDFHLRVAGGDEEYAVKALERIVEDISRDQSTGESMQLVQGSVWKFFDPASTVRLGEPDVIVDASNDAYSQRLLAELGREKGIPVLNASASRYHAELLLEGGEGDLDSKISPDYHGEEQDGLSAALIAGIAADEVRKLIMPLGSEEPISRAVTFNALAENLLGIYDEINSGAHDERYANLSKKRVYVVGAGALGNNVVPMLAQRGVGEIHLWDDDVFEDHNLSRQLLAAMHGDAIGKNKAQVVAQVVQSAYPDVKIVVHEKKFEGKLVKGKAPDAIFRCTDNWTGTKAVNDAARKAGVPAIFMGTDPTAGQAYLHNPGENYCLECIFDVEQNIEAAVVPVGCAVEPDPSVVTTNMVASYLGVTLFERNMAGLEVGQNVIKYNNHNVAQRLYYPFGELAPDLSLKGDCECRPEAGSLGGEDA